jgi:hypothetical protein
MLERKVLSSLLKKQKVGNTSLNMPNQISFVLSLCRVIRTPLRERNTGFLEVTQTSQGKCLR